MNELRFDASLLFPPYENGDLYLYIFVMCINKKLCQIDQIVFKSMTLSFLNRHINIKILILRIYYM
jgi:hypothetical protein